MSAERLREPVLIELAGETPITLRPIRPDDAARLQAFHARLSPQSIYLRWLSAHPLLNDAEAEALCTVDYAGHMAFVATEPDSAGGGERIVGVARYAVTPAGQPMPAAEAAVIVEDGYQGRGLGSALVRRLLAYSLAVGINTWVAEINAENARMLRFIRRSGLPVTRRLEGGTFQLSIDLRSAGGDEPERL